MNINLSPQNFGNIDINNINIGALSESANISDAKASMAILESIQNMLPGQIIEGKIIDSDGVNARLMLDNNVILNSLINSDANLVNGRTISFEVQSNNNGQPVLRPLFTNTVNEATAVKALETADVIVNEKTLSMVDSLMKEGMSIGKDVIQTLNKDMALYPNADVDDIVMLHKLNIEVNDENLTQIGLYRNNNGWMLENVSTLSGNIVELMAETANSDPEGYEKLLTELKSFFEDLESSDLSKSEQLSKAFSENTEVHGKAVIGSFDEESQKSETAALFDKLSKMSPEKLKQSGIKHRILNQFSKILSDKMLMEPEKVSDKSYVKNYYDKMLQLSEKLANSLDNLGKNESAVAKNIDGLKSNINFINNMNEMYNYIQFPLKMADSQANGDLYVYRRKNTKAGGTGNEPLTALLHLSMETLGNMDIFLSLDNDRLSTRFELEKEEMIEFIESHIDELNKRLEDKGYNINTTVEASKNEEHNVIDLINKEIGAVPIMSINGFDARA